MLKWKIVERFLMLSLLFASAPKGMADTWARFPTDAPFTESAPPGR
jgi:hypothetical protein